MGSWIRAHYHQAFLLLLNCSLVSIKSHHLQLAGVVEHPILGNHRISVQSLSVHLIVIIPGHKYFNKCF